MSALDRATRVYYSESVGIIDLIRPDGCTQINGQSAEELREKYPDLQVMSLEEAAERREAKHRHPPETCSEEAWWYALECLPPVAWTRRGGAETFKMSELISGRIADIYCRIGERFFHLQDTITLSHEEIVRRCQEAFP